MFGLKNLIETFETIEKQRKDKDGRDMLKDKDMDAELIRYNDLDGFVLIPMRQNILRRLYQRYGYHWWMKYRAII